MHPHPVAMTNSYHHGALVGVALIVHTFLSPWKKNWDILPKSLLMSQLSCGLEVPKILAGGLDWKDVLHPLTISVTLPVTKREVSATSQAGFKSIREETEVHSYGE